jgi:hypothetical protein
MQLFQFVLRCVRTPLEAVVHRPAYHHVVHHIGRLGRRPIHRIVAHTPPGFGLACRYVLIGTAIGAAALAPPVAMFEPFDPAISPPVNSGASDFGQPSGMFGGSGDQRDFEPKNAAGDAPFQFAIGVPPAFDNLPPNLTRGPGPDDIQPIFPSTIIPPGVASAPTGVPEPPTFVLLLTGFLAALLYRRRGIRRATPDLSLPAG